MLKMSRQNLTIAVLIIGLAYFPKMNLAQEPVNWLAEYIAMSNNGRYLAVQFVTDVKKDNLNYVREIWIYNLDDLTSPPQYLAGVDDYASVFSFSPNSQQVAVDNDGRLKVFDTEDHSLIFSFSNPLSDRSAFSSTLSYNPDSTYIMSNGYAWSTRDGEISVWDTETGLRVHALPTYRPQEYVNRPWLSPDWRHFLDWSHPDGLRIHEFDIDHGVTSHLVTISEAADGAVFSPDGTLFALATAAEEIHVFRTDTWELTFIQALGDNSCGGKHITMGFGNTNPWLLCNGNGWLLIWDMETGELLLRDSPEGTFSHISSDDGIVFADHLIHVPVDYVHHSLGRE